MGNLTKVVTAALTLVGLAAAGAKFANELSKSAEKAGQDLAEGIQDLFEKGVGDGELDEIMDFVRSISKAQEVK